MRYPVYFGCFGRTGAECVRVSVFDDADGTFARNFNPDDAQPVLCEF